MKGVPSQPAKKRHKQSGTDQRMASVPGELVDLPYTISDDASLGGFSFFVFASIKK